MPKILIVEDDRKIAIALTVRLKAQKYEVLVAGDALWGTSLAIKEQPDLILLDISMPAGGGFLVAKRVQQNVMTSAIPIIFLTASKDPSLRKKAMEFSPAAFIEKPYDAGKLVAAIREALGEQVEAK